METSIVSQSINTGIFSEDDCEQILYKNTEKILLSLNPDSNDISKDSEIRLKITNK